MCIVLWTMEAKNSVGNSHRSVGPRLTTLEEDQKLFVDFSILCLWCEIQGMRTYNFLTEFQTLAKNLKHYAQYNIS